MHLVKCLFTLFLYSFKKLHLVTKLSQKDFTKFLKLVVLIYAKQYLK